MKLGKILLELVNRKHNNLKTFHVTIMIAIKIFCHIFLKKVYIFDLIEKYGSETFLFYCVSEFGAKATKRL